MDMQKSIGFLLILFAFILGYFGVKNMGEKEADIKIGEVHITAKSEESKTRGYIYLGGAALLLAVGAVLVSRAKKV
jgi:4-hydroxybenzoate polyprenyltransferase